MAGVLPQHALGRWGEEETARRLARDGWRIMDRNWRPERAKSGIELDIIAVHEQTLVFVEVKTRSSRSLHETVPGTSSGSPFTQESAFAPLEIPSHARLTPGKKRRLLRAAGYYLSSREFWDSPCRFDLVCITRFPDGQLLLEHYRNVIELRHAMDSGDAAWQPW